MPRGGRRPVPAHQWATPTASPTAATRPACDKRCASSSASSTGGTNQNSARSSTPYATPASWDQLSKCTTTSEKSSASSTPSSLIAPNPVQSIQSTKWAPERPSATNPCLDPNLQTHPKHRPTKPDPQRKKFSKHHQTGPTMTTQSPTPPSPHRRRSSPSARRGSVDVAPFTATTAGIPYSRAVIAGCESAPPVSVTIPATIANSGVHDGVVGTHTSTSPGRSRRPILGSCSTRAGPVTTPRLAADPAQLVARRQRSCAAASAPAPPPPRQPPLLPASRSSRALTTRPTAPTRVAARSPAPAGRTSCRPRCHPAQHEHILRPRCGPPPPGRAHAQQQRAHLARQHHLPVRPVLADSTYPSSLATVFVNSACFSDGNCRQRAVRRRRDARLAPRCHAPRAMRPATASVPAPATAAPPGARATSAAPAPTRSTATRGARSARRTPPRTPPPRVSLAARPACRHPPRSSTPSPPASAAPAPPAPRSPRRSSCVAFSPPCVTSNDQQLRILAGLRQQRRQPHVGLEQQRQRRERLVEPVRPQLRRDLNDPPPSDAASSARACTRCGPQYSCQNASAPPCSRATSPHQLGAHHPIRLVQRSRAYRNGPAHWKR